jgi:mannosyltransferase OCH1-like enzyme
MTIHYVWLGKGEKSPKIKYCIESWKKLYPDAEIKEWNEDNYDINSNAYVKKAYEDKKYAFASDYIRFDILYRFGGVYLDTDVELIKDITPLLGTSFMGFERDEEVAPGLIMYAAKTGEPLIKELLDFYQSIRVEDISYALTIVDITTEILKKHGLKPNNTLQNVAGFTIYPTEYFNPKGGDYGKEIITKNTYSIHHYLASWKSPLDQKIMQYKVKYGRKKGILIFSIRHPFLAIKKHREKK